MRVLNKYVHENFKKYKLCVDIAESYDRHFTVSLTLGHVLSYSMQILVWLFPWRTKFMEGEKKALFYISASIYAPNFSDS